MKEDLRIRILERTLATMVPGVLPSLPEILLAAVISHLQFKSQQE